MLDPDGESFGELILFTAISLFLESGSKVAENAEVWS